MEAVIVASIVVTIIQTLGVDMEGLGWMGPVASIAGKAFDYMNAKSAANRARDDANNAFSRRISQAKKHGIHPLAAINAGGFSGGSAVQAFSNFGDMGQDISRAVAATSTSGGRVEQLTLRNMELRNQLLEGQISNLQRDQVGPAVPGGYIPGMQGQGSASVVGPQGISVGDKFYPIDPVGYKQTPVAGGGGGYQGIMIPHPAWSDAQKWQDRHGEPAEWLTFIPRMGMDIGNTIKQRFMGGRGWGERLFGRR